MHPINLEGNRPPKTKTVLALPSYDRQRLSVIRRGWCPSRFQKNILEIERVIRSDVSEAHRLSLSARVLSAQDGQVKAKQQERSTSAACRISASRQLDEAVKSKPRLTGSKPNRPFLPG